jgi:hypothetical protein
MNRTSGKKKPQTTEIFANVKQNNGVSDFSEGHKTIQQPVWEGTWVSFLP